MDGYRAFACGQIYRTDKYILSLSEDSYHGVFVSITGYHSSTAEPASLQWIGSSLRRSLLTSSQFRFREEDWDENAFEKYRDASSAVLSTILGNIKSEFGYRSESSVLAKALTVVAHWPKDSASPIELYACNTKQGGVFEALANKGKRPSNFRQLSIDASDCDLGRAVREMLAVSTLSGRQIDMPTF